MRKLHSRFMSLLMPFTLAAMSAAGAQPSFALLHSLLDPGTNAQMYAHQGWSVAVDGNIAVVGAPLDFVGGAESGVAKIYDVTTGALLHTLTNPTPAVEDWFGYSVAISGQRLVVGALNDDTGDLNSGSAYVYDLSSATPTEPTLTLTNPEPASNEFFGTAVAISGTRVAVGAPEDDATGQNGGSVYVYDLAGPSTSGVPMLTLHNHSVFGDYLGYSVALSGTILAVGAYGEDSPRVDSGRVSVFDLASVTPTNPIVLLYNPNPGFAYRFGFSVGISGTRIAVGAPQDDTGAENTGRAYMYDLASGTPTVPVLTVTNPSPEPFDEFGWSIAISGTRMVVGARYDDNGGEDTGGAYVYDLADATPAVPVASLNSPGPPEADLFGWSVAISGTRVVVGAVLDAAGATDAGAAYVYDLASGTPEVPVVSLTAPSPAVGDYFGASIAISGSRIVGGLYGDDAGADAAGSACAYDLASPTPDSPVVRIPNPSPGLEYIFGYAVAIDGSRVLVSAPQDDTGADEAGAVYVYDLAGTTPNVPVLMLTNPSPVSADWFGNAVAISGTRLVVGMVYNDTGASDAGSAYVFDLAGATPTVPVVTLTNPSPADFDYFGISVGISGSRVVIAAYGDDTGAADAGIAYVYDVSSATPAVPQIILTNPSPATSDLFGNSVAVCGTRVLVGASHDDTGATDAGSAYLYDVAGSTPSVPILTLTNSNPAASNYFGCSVALSGNWLVVGACGEDGGAGSVYVYDVSSATPSVPISILRSPTPAVGDSFGYSVAVDSDTIVVGEPYDGTKAASRGAAYVFGLRPALDLVPLAPDFATLSWTPANSPGFVLQYAESLPPTNWVNAPSGGTNPVTISTTNAGRFYRLAQP